MWADNEVNVDLLNVAHLTAAVLSLVDDDNVAPVTIGVYGDWGSGKSTVLRLVETELRSKSNQDAGVVCVWFNSWQFETYDDAKAAIMSAILEELRAQRGALVKAKASILRLAKRVKWFRAAGLAAKGLGRVKLAMVTGGMSEAGLAMAKSLKDGAGEIEGKDLADLIEEDEDASGSGSHSVREFRDEFEKLLKEADVKRLVVIIDDLDRCLPERVIDTLEAIKLFLLVPRTAFIIGADEGLVRAAVATRFASVLEAKEQLGLDYLEKLVQIPVHVPPMSQGEAEGYMNLLFAQLRLPKEAFDALCSKRLAAATPAIDTVSFGYDDAKKYLEEVPAKLQADFTLVSQIGGLLAAQTNGNPRQTKRFLNALLLRLKMAEARKVAADTAVMAKLMLLEYVRRESFSTLGEWQRAQGGKPSELGTLESAIRAHAKAEDLDIAANVKSWLADPWLVKWLAVEPMLNGVDLGPYFYFAKHRRFDGALTQRLSPAANAVFEGLTSEKRPTRIAAERDAANLSEMEASATFAALAARAGSYPVADAGADHSPLMALVALASVRNSLIGELITLLRRTSPRSLPFGIVSKLVNLTNHTPHAPATLALLDEWTVAAKDTKLGTAAGQWRERVKQGPAVARLAQGGR